mmetsp:Transcript_49410/g.148888  ORF Transcript_49410/g.148888 Transcript_49410/m.148888 type:complete len:406 (-) Transcript_49410:14-1231(-)
MLPYGIVVRDPPIVVARLPPVLAAYTAASRIAHNFRRPGPRRRAVRRAGGTVGRDLRIVGQRGTDGVVQAARERIVVEEEQTEFGQVGHGGRDLSRQSIPIEQQVVQSGEISQLGRDGIDEFVPVQIEEVQSIQRVDPLRDGTRDVAVLEAELEQSWHEKEEGGERLTVVVVPSQEEILERQRRQRLPRRRPQIARELIVGEIEVYQSLQVAEGGRDRTVQVILVQGQEFQRALLRHGVRERSRQFVVVQIQHPQRGMREEVRGRPSIQSVVGQIQMHEPFVTVHEIVVHGVFESVVLQIDVPQGGNAVQYVQIAREEIVVEGEDAELGHLGHAGGERAADEVVAEAELLQFLQVAHSRGDVAADSAVRHGDGGEVGEVTDFGGEDALEAVIPGCVRSGAVRSRY